MFSPPRLTDQLPHARNSQRYNARCGSRPQGAYLHDGRGTGLHKNSHQSVSNADGKRYLVFYYFNDLSQRTTFLLNNYMASLHEQCQHMPNCETQTLKDTSWCQSGKSQFTRK